MRRFFTQVGACALTVGALLLGTQAKATVSTNGGSGLAGSYADLAAAITALNGAVMTGNVVITVDLGFPQIAPAGGYSITQLNATAFTITIDGNGQTVTANSGNTIGAINDAIFKIIGGDRITIQNFVMTEDNVNNTVVAPPVANNDMTEFGVALFYASTTDGPQNCTVQNNTISLNRLYVNSFGVYANTRHTATSISTTADATTAGGSILNLHIYSNQISNVNMGIIVVGSIASGAQATGVEIGGTVGTANTLTNFGTTTTSFSSYVGVSGTVQGVLCSNANSFTISFNSITSSVGGTVAGTLAGIQCLASGTATLPAGGPFNRTINNNTFDLRTGNATGIVNGIVNSYTANTTTVVSINNNNFTNLTGTVASTGAITCINSTSASQTETINSNTFTNLAPNNTGSFTFISASHTVPAAGTQNVNGNNIVTAFNKTGVGGTVTLFTQNGSSVATATCINDLNNFSNITVAGTTVIAGWSNTDGGSVNHVVSNNTFNNWVGGTGAITGININFGGAGGGDGTMTSGNTVSNISSAGAITGIALGASGTTHTAEGNTISGLTSTGAVSILGISTSTLSGTYNVRKNRICNIEANNAAGAVYGIFSTGGITVNISNNRIGDLRAPNTNAASINIAGIASTSTTASSTHNVSYNTILLQASSSGANFNTAGLFATASTTATTATLNLIDNIIVNKSTPNGTGLATALTRSAGTAGMLANYGAASDRNLLYAGTPSATHPIYFDGTTTAQSLTDYQTGVFTAGTVAPRDANSVTADPLFLSTTCGSANFLKINPGVATPLESGGINIAGITNDFENEVRQGNGGYAGTGTAPDIGADEFELAVVCTPGSGTATAVNAGCATYDIQVTITSIGDSPGGLTIQIDGGTVQTNATTGGSPYTFTGYTNASTHSVTLLHQGNPVCDVNLGNVSSNVVCDDNNPATSNGCVSNACTFDPIPCNDGDPCTINDVLVLSTPSENFDGVTAPALPAGWTNLDINAGVGKQWRTRSSTFDTSPNAAYTNDTTSVSDQALVTPVFNSIIAGASFTFKHRWTLESGFDGGVLEININGGGWTDIITAGGSFVAGGYNGVLNTGFSNPLPARSAWTGNFGTSWTTTTVNLPGAAVGQPIQLRFRRGCDSSVDAGGTGVTDGWLIDSFVLTTAVCQGTFQDTDGDTVCDANDVCPGFDDLVDTDGDAIPDGCDPCDNTTDGNACSDGDPCTAGETLLNCVCQGGVFQDADGDGVCDANDVCPGFDDNVDTDGDTIPDGCDPCDNTTDGDACSDGDPCTTGETLLNCVCQGGVFQDADGDGVCDANDICPGFDDNVDTDGDTIPDGCDPCDNTTDGDACSDGDPCTSGETLLNCVCQGGVFQDADGDGVCDANDICPGFDDNVDTDGDTIPDGCDPCDNTTDGDACSDGDPCTSGETLLNCVCQGGVSSDSDGDGVCDNLDICPGFDDNVDTDGDTIPDGCDPCDNTTDGDACSDGDPCTSGETLLNCVCQGGVFQDADGDGVCDANDICPGFDDNVDTDGDTIPDGCDPCDNTTDGNACSDGDPCTTGETLLNCVCQGGVSSDTDSDGVCDALDNCPFTFNPGQEDADLDNIGDACDVACVDLPAQLLIQLDADGGDDITWDIFDVFSNVVASGGTYPGNVNTLITEDLCLPDNFGNCFTLFLYDAAGDGIANTSGYWELRDGSGDLILRDDGVFTSQSPSVAPASADYDGHRFCLPLGPSDIAPANCGVFTHSEYEKVFTTFIPSVSMYQFNFSNPNAGFHRRITVPRNWVKFAEMVTNPLVPGVRYFVRARVDQGAPGFGDDHYGVGCEVAMDPSALNPCTQLIDDPDLSTYSCGVNKTFGGSDKIWTWPIVGATQYQFRFQNIGLGYTRYITQASYAVVLNWVTNPLVAGNTYDVKTQSFKAGVWSGFCGNNCTVTIVPSFQGGGGSLNSAPVDGTTLNLWPNPNRGDQLYLELSAVDAGVSEVSVDLYDIFGKQVMSRTITVDGPFTTVLDLEGSLANGLYMVNLTAGEKTYTERLIIE